MYDCMTMWYAVLITGSSSGHLPPGLGERHTQNEYKQKFSCTTTTAKMEPYATPTAELQNLYMAVT